VAAARACSLSTAEHAGSHFEALVVRDLCIYVQALGGRVEICRDAIDCSYTLMRRGPACQPSQADATISSRSAFAICSF